MKLSLLLAAISAIAGDFFASAKDVEAVSGDTIPEAMKRFRHASMREQAKAASMRGQAKAADLDPRLNEPGNNGLRWLQGPPHSE